MKLCVKKCPDAAIEDFGALLLYTQRSNNSLCRYDFDLNRDDYGYASAVDDQFQPLNSNTIRTYMNIDAEEGVGPCPKYPVLPSKSVLNRCIPTNLVAAGKSVVYSVYEYLNSFDTVKQIVSDVMISWQEILFMTGVAISLTFIVVFLIHFVADFVAWIFLVIVSLSLIILTGVLWWTYIGLRYDLDWNPRWGKHFLDENIRNEKTFLILSLLATIITVIMILICLVMRKRVRLVVALFYESASCIRTMPGLLFQPMWTFLTLVLFFLFWVAVLLALATADYAKENETSLKLRAKRPIISASEVSFGQADISTMKWINFNNASWIRYMWWYLVIAFFWTIEFILGCQQMVIAGAVASWYFTRDRSNLPCPVGRSIRRLVFFHMGTVALGSFLITLFIIPRLIISYIEEKLKDYPDSHIARSLLRCCNCCLYFMESFLRFLNHNAYTVTAIEGSSFCSSARIAFSTISSNALRVAAINSVGDFILFLGKCTVTVITAILATLLLKVRFFFFVFLDFSSSYNISLLLTIGPLFLFLSSVEQGHSFLCRPHHIDRHHRILHFSLCSLRLRGELFARLKIEIFFSFIFFHFDDHFFTLMIILRRWSSIHFSCVSVRIRTRMMDLLVVNIMLLLPFL